MGGSTMAWILEIHYTPKHDDKREIFTIEIGEWKQYPISQDGSTTKILRQNRSQ